MSSHELVMSASRTYGWRGSDIESAANALRDALSIDFQARESLYRGDYYLWPPFDHRNEFVGELVLQENFFDEVDGELVYAEYGDYSVLLFTTHLSEEWAQAIGSTGAERLE